MGRFFRSSSQNVAQSVDCGCCGQELTFIKPSAKFCPNCGTKIRRNRIPFTAFLWAVLPSLKAGASPYTRKWLREDRPDMLAGYANAMYQLGWRYERGHAGKNLSEAQRCYKKSAKLGNIDAAIRLARF